MVVSNYAKGEGYGPKIGQGRAYGSLYCRLGFGEGHACRLWLGVPAFS